MDNTEEKLLRMVYQDLLKGKYGQEQPICPLCNIPINVMDLNISVNYADICINNETVTFMEPYCPKCGDLVRAKPFIVH